MGTDDALVAVLADKFAEYRPDADERGWRLYLGSEARAHAALRDCGLAAAAAVIARAAGVSRATVMAGAGELRRRGAGAGAVTAAGCRPAAGQAQPGLREAFLQVVREGTRGDPMTELTWCSLSLRDIAGRLAARGFSCGKDAAARLMRGEGYSLQSPAKVLEGRQHPDRDAQFGHINAKIAGFCAAGEPVISVDTKKKEYIGPFHRDGQTWRPKGNPVKVCDHSFPGQEHGPDRPLRDLRHHRQPRVRAGRHQLRHGGVRGEHAAPVVAAGRGRALPARHPAAGHRRFRRLQRRPLPALERPAGSARGRDRAAD